MNKARLIITAIHVENLTQQEAAERCGVSQSWVSKLITRFNLEGEARLWRLCNYKSQPILLLRRNVTTQVHDSAAHSGL